MQCKSSPRPKKARISRSQFKAFFNMKGIAIAEWTASEPNGKSAILDRSADKMTRTREKETDGFCASDNALTAKQFLVNKKITVLEHPFYWPKLAPCYFYLFPKIESMLKGEDFPSTELYKLQNCFEQWQFVYSCVS